MNTKEKIYLLKEKKGLSLTKIAESAGVSRDTIMRWDKQSPSLRVLQKVADTLEVPVTELIGD